MKANSGGEFAEHTGTVEALWGRRERPSRGPKPALSLEVIARAGISIADSEGLTGVSMQRVSAELQYTKMSLYRYLAGKAELVALMTDLAMGEPPALGDGDWRSRLREWAHQLWRGFTRHPWVLGTTLGQRIMGPNELGWLECAMAALADTGLDGAEKLDAIVVIAGHTRGIAQQTLPMAGAAKVGSEKQLLSVMGQLLHEHGERYPALTEAFKSAAGSPAADNGLDFGLDRILDGLAQLIQSRREQIDA